MCYGLLINVNSGVLVACINDMLVNINGVSVAFNGVLVLNIFTAHSRQHFIIFRLCLCTAGTDGYWP